MRRLPPATVVRIEEFREAQDPAPQLVGDIAVVVMAMQIDSQHFVLGQTALPGSEQSTVVTLKFLAEHSSIH